MTVFKESHEIIYSSDSINIIGSCMIHSVFTGGSKIDNVNGNSVSKNVKIHKSNIILRTCSTAFRTKANVLLNSSKKCTHFSFSASASGWIKLNLSHKGGLDHELLYCT